jgi:hypothetical protein
MLEQLWREHQERGDRDCADDTRQLGPRARGLGYRRSGRAAADREALEEAGGEVGQAQTHHLLIRIDRRPQAGRVGAGEHARVGERQSATAALPTRLARSAS